MPWAVRQRDGKYIVIQTDTGEQVGSPHDTQEEAEAHRRALYANYSPAKSVEWLREQLLTIKGKLNHE